MAQSSEKKKRRLWYLLFVLFCIGIVAVTAIREFSSVKSAERISISSLNFNYLFGALGAYIVLFLSETIKYTCLIYGNTGKFMPLTAFCTAAQGRYYDNITPFGAGGQPFEILYLRKRGLPKGDASAIPLAGFLGPQFAFVFLALACFIFGPGVNDKLAMRLVAYLGLAFYLAMPAITLMYVFFPNGIGRAVHGCIGFLGRIRISKDPEKLWQKTEESLNEYRVSMRIILGRPWLLAVVSVCSILYQTAIMSIPFFVLHAFGGTAGWLETFTMTLYVYATVTIVPTPGNSGAAEGAFYALFKELQPTSLFWGMLTWRFIVYYMLLLPGLVCVGINAFKEKRK